MVWTPRLLVMLLGVFAWIVSYALAVAALPSAPRYVVPSIVLFGIVFVAACVWSIAADRNVARKSALRDLENDSFALADGIRQMMENTPLVIAGVQMGQGIIETFDALAEQKARNARSKSIAAQYENRFASRTHRLASEFRREDVPQTDVFFKVVDHGPAGEEDVFQIVAGLERLARQLREKPQT